jgi:hypothetical protein
VKGQGVKRWAASTVRGIGAICALALFVEAAQAGSRFETSQMPSTKPAASLDFTIVIPEVVYLGSAKATLVSETPQQLTARGVDGAKPREPYVVLTNGGTLAFAPTGVDQTRPLEFGAKGLPPEASPIRAYLVAMP